MIRCTKCNSENVKAWVSLQMYIDAKDYSHITKKVINKKSTEIWSQDTDRTNFVCGDCGYTTKSLQQIKLEQGRYENAKTNRI